MTTDPVCGMRVETPAFRRRSVRPNADRHHVPVKVYRALDMLTVAAPMAGLGPEDGIIEVTSDGHLLLDGRLRPEQKVDGGANDAGKEILLEEWTIFPYRREIVLDIGGSTARRRPSPTATASSWWHCQ